MRSEREARRRFVGAALIALVVRPLGAAESAVVSLGAAINKAGRQRMLSQRMAKAFTMLVLGAMPEKAEVLLAQSRRLFEAQLAELASVAPSTPIKGALLDLERAWGGYREALGGARTPENLRLVLVEADRTLRAAHQLTGLYEKQAGGSAGHLVNLSGRQRMLSQRMAKCFLVERSGIVSGALKDELEAARRDFVAALKELNQAPENTPEISVELALANTQWLFFEQALNGRETGELAVRNVATTSERILEVMDALTGRYEKLVRG